MTSRKEILVEGDYGEGAYGPTILLRALSPDGVALLRSIFDDLANASPGSSRRLDTEPGVVLGAAITELRLRVSSEKPSRHLVQDRMGAFVWTCTAEEWGTLGLLIEPLLRQRGHQYLTSEIEDDALVEVSFGEHS